MLNVFILCSFQVFFPIHKYDHFYLITYHLKKTTYEIIDNIKRDEHEEICYGEVPDMLVRTIKTFNLNH